MSPWKPGSKTSPLLSRRRSDPRRKQLSTTDTGQHFCCCCLGRRWHLEQTVHKQKALGEEAGNWDTIGAAAALLRSWGLSTAWAHLAPGTGSGKVQRAPSSHPWLTVRLSEGAVRKTEPWAAWLHVEDVYTHTHMHTHMHTHPSSSKTGKSFGSRHLRKSCLIISW